MTRSHTVQASTFVAMAFCVSLGVADEHSTDSAEENPKQAGIGVALAIEDETFTIFKIVPDTPADRNGLLKPSDRIVAVAEGDGKPVELAGMKMKAAVGLIRGPEGSLVRLTIISAGESAQNARVVSLRRGTFSELDMFVDGRLLPTDSVAPNFRFQRLSDASESELVDLAGRVLVIDFWASWCGPCITTLDELQTIIGEHPEWEGKVELLAVSVDGEKEDAIRIAKEKKWSGMTVLWAGPELLRTYHVGSLPTVFIVDEQGRIAAADNRLNVPDILKSLLQNK
ncbi:TlpA disulfide reductase family protein [Aureliella helgolandensis]|uniref:Thiol-disulfide oxidoreductase ResA n=1 Tax=Aureliella helgolandensis TaxID=2527968 RepID=A0A518GBF3_9BACT|nr:TlpA disulfide reductase family protein [Aureliella helgolandensis]QDV25928.1 Thiol-disulfide oxidoreductase ResA [Aureliella helgolandensis]